MLDDDDDDDDPARSRRYCTILYYTVRTVRDDLLMLPGWGLERTGVDQSGPLGLSLASPRLSAFEFGDSVACLPTRLSLLSRDLLQL